ncbi:MAG: hypothetical protein ACKVS6_02700 [Planctomycetota bacterium]
MRPTSALLSIFAAGAAFLLYPTASAQHVRRGELRPQDRALFDTFGDVAKSWTVDCDMDIHNGGGVRRIRGDLGLAPGEAAKVAREFTDRFGAFFNFGGSIEYTVSTAGGSYKNGNARYVRLQQIVRGFVANEYGITISLDSRGRATGAHGIVSEALALAAPPVFNEVAARVFALAALGASGFPESLLKPGAGNIEKIARAGEGGPRLLYRVNVIIKKDWRPLGVEIDAITGAAVRMIDRSSSGTGNYQFNDQVFQFSTANGKGNVYSSIANALKEKHSYKPLAELGVDDIDGTPAVDGAIYGRYGQTLDANFFDAFSANHIFTFNSNDPATGDLFDQVNIYYWIQQSATKYAKLFGPLPTDRCMPIVVNVPGVENAFFAPVDLGAGFGEGFLLFGDPSSQTGDLMDDYSRDMSVASHEYLHAVADGLGLQFGAADVDFPPRAVNEAIADYFSASLHKDPRIGPIIAFNHLGPDLLLLGESIRNLSDDRVFPDDLNFLVGQTGLPEEHEAGVIFGATLWRLREVLKDKIADPIIAASLPNWPQTMREAGFPVVDISNAQDAYGAFYAQCLQTLFDDLLAAKGNTTAAKGLGAMLANGAIGNPSNSPIVHWDATAGLNISFDSEFLNLNDHAIRFTFVAGQKIDITITGNSSDGTLVDFLILDPGSDFTFPNAKVVTGNNNKVSQKQITVVNPGMFTFYFQNAGQSPGRYKLQMKVK